MLAAVALFLESYCFVLTISSALGGCFRIFSVARLRLPLQFSSLSLRSFDQRTNSLHYIDKHSSQNPLQREGLLISGSGFFTTEAGGFSDKSRDGSEFGGGFSAEQSKKNVKIPCFLEET